MIETLTTYAEKQAEKAESLPAFSGIKILHIKRQLAELLGLIGRSGIFDEYTRHDISHVDEMLKILEWLIPETTKVIMSPADWLLTVLAIYFHDLGMLVTKKEFEERNTSRFPTYRDIELFGGDAGKDYRAKVEGLSSEEAEHFLYQEFVRNNHAERIRAWVMGKTRDDLGIAHHLTAEINRLIEPLRPQFRRDLAFVCESHHLEDLYDLEKYKVSQPYGNSDAETANVQYAAVLLRAADLLNVTRDRTPSVVFRTIDPVDPISQQEWAKQLAVTRVRSRVALDQRGNPDENAPRDTIEVHAYFTSKDGFFGLTYYLKYAAEQLRKCYEWAETARKKKGIRHEFPWRYIDDSSIETEGFLRDTFEFTIDRARILDLLTGHTLYNDTRVVLRELVQNSLDAIRLQRHIDQKKGIIGQPGKVLIHWDSKQRVLSVEDNGTGMTQDVIVRHLLKVGASRYQDPQFKKQYPDFSSISRFGIGVLSAFMVADTVEILTCHVEDEDWARQLSLRSVYGKYLIQLLDKKTDESAKRLMPHGTLVRLRVRSSADMPDVVESAQRWVVVPDCEVSVSVDDALPVQVGFSSPKDALVALLQENGLLTDDVSSGGKRKIQIKEKEIDGCTVAYAVEWSDFFDEWTFLRYDKRIMSEKLLLGTCIEGIRAEFNTPGFEDRTILAIANVKGPNAPKTNVVRSSLELTPERDTMLRTIYSIYCSHVGDEIDQLCARRGFSLTWAIQEARYVLSPLLPEQEDLDTPPEKKISNLDFMMRQVSARFARGMSHPRHRMAHHTPGKPSAASHPTLPRPNR